MTVQRLDLRARGKNLFHALERESIVDERVKFIADVLKGDHTVTELCQRYQISRKTGYKWIGSLQEAGPKGLEDLGRK